MGILRIKKSHFAKCYFCGIRGNTKSLFHQDDGLWEIIETNEWDFHTGCISEIINNPTIYPALIDDARQIDALLKSYQEGLDMAQQKKNRIAEKKQKLENDRIYLRHRMNCK